MKFIFAFSFFILLLRIPVFASGEIDTTINIIPRPVSIQHHTGVFHFSSQTKIVAADSSSARDAQAFNAQLKNDFGFQLEIVKKTPGTNFISIQTFRKKNSMADEYHLTVSPNNIRIEGNGAGVFYALTSLLQLPVKQDDALYLPCVSIDDYPRFAWRGMHLDCCRHFFTKEFVEQYISYLARYKFNTFHWHLTDDQGWRIEIKKYPLLTQVGAWRNGSMIGAYRDQKFDSLRYGGFYTQNDVHEVVAYAQARHINIVPEIEMPGHCLAALASYPQFSCTGGPFEVGKSWGTYDDIFCPKEKTFTFLKNVLSEVCDLFPGKYIHVGGDEVSKVRWKECVSCQQLIRKFNLKDEEGLQSYFTSRIDSFLTSKGKQLVGWDEILKGGLSPNAVVMSWQGTDGGIAAAKQNHDAVMCPGTPCYFDHYQSQYADEPLAIGGYNPIEAVYAYEPIPATLLPEDARHILGAQANVWTEYLNTPSQVEYMVFPRLCAMAEILWSPNQNKSFSDFVKRLLVHFNYFNAHQINYSKVIFDVKLMDWPSVNHNGLVLKLSTLFPKSEIHYSLDGSDVKKSSPVFHDSIFIHQSGTLLVKTFSEGGNEGKQRSFNFSFNLATAKDIWLKEQPSPKYNYGGAFRLVDGRTGLLPWRGNDWLGFSGTNMDATIDLQMKTAITSVTVDVLEDKVSWIYLPKSIRILISDDGKNFQLLKTVDASFIQQSQRSVKIQFEKTSARYVKVIAENVGKIPESNPGAGNSAWLFVDEINIE